MAQLMARPMGDGGACWISSTAGRKSAAAPLGTVPSPLPDSARHAALKMAQCREIEPSDLRAFEASLPVTFLFLEVVQPRVEPLRAKKFFVRPFLHNLALFDDINSMGRPYGAESMCNDENRAPSTNLCHVFLNDGF